jgi:hypothetical protein
MGYLSRFREDAKAKAALDGRVVRAFLKVAAN